jgi:hypothetical protein
MKTFFFLLFIFIFTASSSQQKPDSSRVKFTSSATFSLNSNGFSTIPAFSLGKPAVMASVALAKGRLSYDPVLAYGMDMKPWFIDSWIHYMLINKTSFKLRTGFNFSMFFNAYKLPDKTILQGERYWAIELAGFYYLSSKTILTLMYWNDRGQDPGTIKGHFINMSAERNEINLGRSFLLNISVQLFYIGYEGNNDGLFISPKISTGLRSAPVSLFLQAMQPFTTNISPNPGFRWNLGIAYTFQ